MYKKYFKRLLDLIAAIICFIFLSPIFLMLVIFLFISNNGEPFFFQIRPGKNSRLFKIWKFKTMSNKCDLNGNLLPDEERITSIGAFVRRTSLDELPQLLNVISGNMSLVGPRPLLPEYLALYSEEQLKRHDVKPGITGWAQINGRNAIGWSDKFAYDVWYVENLSFGLDIKILFRTVRKVILSDGISSQTSATMEEFKGNIDK